METSAYSTVPGSLIHRGDHASRTCFCTAFTFPQYKCTPSGYVVHRSVARIEAALKDKIESNEENAPTGSSRSRAPGRIRFGGQCSGINPKLSCWAEPDQIAQAPHLDLPSASPVHLLWRGPRRVCVLVSTHGALSSVGILV